MIGRWVNLWWTVTNIFGIHRCQTGLVLLKARCTGTAKVVQEKQKDLLLSPCNLFQRLGGKNANCKRARSINTSTKNRASGLVVGHNIIDCVLGNRSRTRQNHPTKSLCRITRHLSTICLATGQRPSQSVDTKFYQTARFFVAASWIGQSVVYQQII